MEMVGLVLIGSCYACRLPSILIVDLRYLLFVPPILRMLQNQKEREKTIGQTRTLDSLAQSTSCL
jgi:hypothetical protein